MRQQNITLEISKTEGKDWDAAKYQVTVNVPETEAEFVKASNGVSSLDFAIAQFVKKAENAAVAAYKNQKEADTATRIQKSQDTASNFTLNSRGEGIRTAAKAAESYLDSITDPTARAAMEALIAKAKGDK